MGLDLESGLRVLKVISRHSLEAPVVSSAIEEATGVSPRVISEIVAIAVSEGVPIGSGGRGYFRWRNSAERDAYLHQEKARILAISEKLRAIERSEVDQFTLFE
jgi:hypothetical protein